MTIKYRVQSLEKLKQQAVIPAGDEASKHLWNAIMSHAKRVEPITPDEDWCAAQSPITVLSKSLMAIHCGGESSPALWARVHDLAERNSTVGKLFAGLESEYGNPAGA